jgi:hypothetical protein
MNRQEAEKSIVEVRIIELYTNLEAGPAQIERLAQLGVLTQAELEAGRNAGGLSVRVPTRLVAEFEQNQAQMVATPAVANVASSSGVEQLTVPSAEFKDDAAEIERLARRIDESGMNGVARLFIASNRPLSFFASQLLLLVQPVSRFTLGIKDPTGRYSRLLENRANLDKLLNRLDELETARRRTRHIAKKERQ